MLPTYGPHAPFHQSFSEPFDQAETAIHTHLRRLRVAGGYAFINPSIPVEEEYMSKHRGRLTGALMGAITDRLETRSTSHCYVGVFNAHSVTTESDDPVSNQLEGFGKEIARRTPFGNRITGFGSA